MDSKHELTVEDLIAGKKELLGFDPTDERECMRRVAENGYAISLVDPDVVTDNMAMCAVMSTPYAIQFIPRVYITNSLMMAAVVGVKIQSITCGFLRDSRSMQMRS